MDARFRSILLGSFELILRRDVSTLTLFATCTRPNSMYEYMCNSIQKI
jgi:hypothetical protein